MNNGLIGVYLVIILAIVMALLRNRRQMMRKIILRKKHSNREGFRMTEAIKRFLGKECVVYTFENNAVKGVIEAEEDGWLRIQTKKGTQLVNPDFVSRIREA